MDSIGIIQDQAEFFTLIQELAKARHISIDTESNSFYAYFNRICLIQVSTPARDFIIDPLALKDISALGDAFSNPEIEKIFHAAPNDIAGLKHDFKFEMVNIFDTAVACKLLGYKQLGLAKILNEHFGITLNKKWQRYDWGKRPLKPELIDYARLDTHYLIPLRHRLAAGLEEQGLWDQARIEFLKISEQEIQEKNFRPGNFVHLCGAQALDSAGKRVLKALYLYRENEARRKDRAPFRILSNETLVRLAHQRPKNLSDFSKIKGIPRSFTNGRTAAYLLNLIRKNEAFGEDLHVRQ